MGINGQAFLDGCSGQTSRVFWMCQKCKWVQDDDEATSKQKAKKLAKLLYKFIWQRRKKKGHETVEIRKDTGEAVRAAFCLPISKTETQKAEPAGPCWPSLPGLNIPSTQKKRGKREASQTEIGWILAYRQHSTAHTCKSWWACNLLTICIQVGMAESPKRESKKKARGFARQKSINCNQVEWSGTKRVAGKMLRFLIKVFDFGHFLHFPLMAIIWQQKK